jgi:ketosteroid isomerase-like protein
MASHARATSFAHVSVFADINRDIWLAFQAAHARLDLDAMAAFHAPDLVRVGADERWIGGLPEHLARTRDGFARAAEQGDRLAIDFRFVERIADDTMASERGMYRVAVTASDGTEQIFHGRFHSISRRTPDGWRLVLDYDSDSDGGVGADHFAAGVALDDTAPFDP